MLKCAGDLTGSWMIHGLQAQLWRYRLGALRQDLAVLKLHRAGGRAAVLKISVAVVAAIQYDSMTSTSDTARIQQLYQPEINIKRAKFSFATLARTRGFPRGHAHFTACQLASSCWFIHCTQSCFRRN